MATQSDRRIAIVTPWPPQASGIADYARCLRDGLRQNDFTVDVYTNAASDLTDRVYTIPSVEDAVANLSGYDRVLVQLGNHPHFHAYMVPIIAALGRKCVVELHDIRLDHMLGGLNYAGDPDFIQRWMRANYAGHYEVSNARPVSDVVCRHASTVIVHSHYAADWLKKLGVARVRVVDLSYDLSGLIDPPPHLLPKSKIHIGIFGTFQKSRQIPLVLEALETLHTHGIAGWHLHIVGRPCDGYETLLSAISSSQISNFVSVHENVSINIFLGLMSAMDVHVALRSPSVGETSGVVVQGMILGVPTIVSDGGWYAELPSAVEKIPVSNGLYELTKALYRHISDQTRRLSFGSNTKSFAAEAYALGPRAEEIGEILVNG